ncbi:MAG: EAL domain-containing protein [Nitrospiria bacterium]
MSPDSAITTGALAQRMNQYEHYRKIIEHADDAMLMVDPRGHFLAQNERHESLFGFSDAALQDRTPAVYLGKSSCASLMATLSKQPCHRGEMTGQTQSGAMREVSFAVFPMINAQGAIDCYLISYVDIGDQRRSNTALQLYAAVLGQTTKGMLVMDAEGRILSMNDAFSKITGFRLVELAGKMPEALYSGLQGPDIYPKLWNRLKTEGQWQGEIWNRRKDGVVYPELAAFQAIKGNKGEIIYYVGTFSDITERDIPEERKLYLTLHDILTDLPNCRLLNVRLVQALKQAERKHEKLALLYMDLDHFKTVNDALGKVAGDNLLIEVGQRLKKCVRDCDTVSRLSHDTFVILLTESSEIEHTATIAKKILNHISKPVLLDHHPIIMTGSIGISLYPIDGADKDALLRHAEAAMARVKHQGRNGYQFYSKEMDEKTLERIELKMAMQRALEREEFKVFYQPQVDLKGGGITGIEALVRWQHPDKGLILPADFIPMAEETSLILPIGEWVLRTACRQLKMWRESGFSKMRMAVNLSALQFQQAHLSVLVREVLNENAIDPDALELEITESFTMEHVGRGIETMKALQDLGVKLAVDDFGIGYSSLGYLRQFPIHTLKVDQSFIKGLTHNPDDAAITSAIIAMAQNLNLSVVAEGVETKDQLAFLKNHGCDSAQGFYFCHPMPVKLFEDFLKTAPGIGAASRLN